MSNSAMSVTGTGGGGGFTLLAVATASASSELDLNQVFNSGYNEYIVYFTNLVPATNATYMTMQVGTGATPTWITASSYNYVNLIGDNGGSDAATNNDTSFRVTFESGHGISSSFPLNGTLTIYGANGSSNVLAYTSQCIYMDAATGTTVVIDMGGGQIAANTYTSIRFVMSSGNFASGTIKIFGVNNS